MSLASGLLTLIALGVLLYRRRHPRRPRDVQSYFELTTRQEPGKRRLLRREMGASRPCHCLGLLPLVILHPIFWHLPAEQVGHAPPQATDHVNANVQFQPQGRPMVMVRGLLKGNGLGFIEM